VLQRFLTSNAIDQGSQVAFSPSGAVNVAFEQYSPALPTERAILFRRAPSLGGLFGAAVKVADVVGVGGGTLLQGGFRALIDLQGMAVDRSGLSTNGSIYIVWHGSDLVDSDHIFNGVLYSYSDVWINKSTNNGVSWSAPVQVNTNTEPLLSEVGVPIAGSTWARHEAAFSFGGSNCRDAHPFRK